MDANTKNYVFLTLSQYNADQDLVRTRVSMRRDQPFWDGGNSYICCESFRVTSSPSQGGLYYKLFPYDWYMGCKIPQDRDAQPPNNDASWESSVVSSTAAEPTMAALMLVTGGGDHGTTLPTFTNNDNTLETELVVWGVVDHDIVPDTLESQDPRTIRAALEGYCNQYMLANKGWVRIVQDTGANGNDPGYAIGRLQGNPANAITGNGLGVDSLYYPEIEVAHPATALNTLAVMAALSKPAIVDQAFEISFKLLGQPNSGEVTMASPEYNSLLNNMGKGLHVQVRTSHTHPKVWQPVVYGGIYNVLGVVGMEYEFEQQFFPDTNVAPDTRTRGACSGAPYRPMFFSEWKEGATCWIDIDANDAKFTAGRYYGHVQVLPNIAAETFVTGFMGSIQTNYVTLDLHLQATDVLYDLITTGAPEDAPLPIAARTEMLAQKWILTTTNQAVGGAIKTKIKFDIEEEANLAKPFQDIGAVQFAANRNAHQKVSIRRPNKYIYTPNEMFFAFNHVDHQVGHLPYKIQTDENGGFCIYWQPDDSTSHSFIISVGLSEALGLNNFFEYDWDEYLHDTDYNLMYLMKVSHGTHQDEDISVWMNHDDLFLDEAKTVDVPMPVPAGIDGAPLIVWDSDGNEYTYVRTYEYRERRFQTIKRYVNATVHTDEDGTQYYRYNNLPGNGYIRNTEMVSVESFSTYSEITLVIPNLPFQSMLGTSSDERILASLRLPFENGTNNDGDGQVTNSTFSYYGDLIFNTLASRSYLKVTTDQALYDCDVEVRLIRRDGQMDVMQLPFQGEFQVKLRLLQTQ